MKTFDQFMEAFFDTIRGRRSGGGRTDVYHNPTRKEYRDHAYKHEGTGGSHEVLALLHHDGSMHTANAYEANHADVMPHVKDGHKALPVLINHYPKDKEVIVTSSHFSASDEWKNKSSEEKEHFVKNHAHINNMFSDCKKIYDI